ncbi:unnamed protein product [Cunninghamella echinulata]
MEKTFAGLLRHSRLASYDRTIPQVYTTPSKSKKIGNWGLKRSLPTVVRTRYVTIGNLDTAEHQTPWQSGESQVLFIKRWKENFPNSKAPSPRREKIQHNVAAMTSREFKHFLKQASQQAPGFQQALKDKQVVAEQVYDYLNCHFNKDIMNDYHQQHQQEGGGGNGGGIVGPTYSDYDAGWNYVVTGRILNSDSEGFAVGIGGVVAKLSRRNTSQLRYSGDRKIRQFYVLDARINEQGKPEVNVNVEPTLPSVSSLLSPSYYNNDYRYNNNNNNNNTEPGLDDMFAGRRSSRFGGLQSSTETDNSRPNPQHGDLMERISSLLDQKK